jgi:hypothetical protein
MCRFGDLEEITLDPVPNLHRVFAPVIADEAHRKAVLTALQRKPVEVRSIEAIEAKRVTDLYLSIVAHRLWPEFVKSSSRK